MDSIFPSAQLDRVRSSTSERELKEVERRIEESVRFYTTQPASAITARIEELEKEWDMERWLETNASALAFTGVALGLTVNKKWLGLPLVETGFLFQHAVQGWCPPVPVLRRMGVRTRSEIDREKYALKMLRGDFQQEDGDVEEELRQARQVLDAINA